MKIMLNSIFPLWYEGKGIFSYLDSLDVPWKDENISLSLDLDYHGNISGDKTISPFLDKIIDDSSLDISDELKQKIAAILLNMYGTNWLKLWNTLNFEYNPIENYSMEEVMTDDITKFNYGKSHKITNNLTHSKEGTEKRTPDTQEKRTDNLTQTVNYNEEKTPQTIQTRTDNLNHLKTGTETKIIDETGVTTPELDNTVNSAIFAFNSSESVPISSEKTESGGTNTLKTDGTDTTEFNIENSDTGTQKIEMSGKDTIVREDTQNNTGTQIIAISGSDENEYNLVEKDIGTREENDSGEDSHIRNYSLKRSGNIGVTTSQQMIESERKLWIWNFFYNVVFPDIDRVLTIQIY